MTILWIYDRQFNQQAGGTESATQSIIRALAERGISSACLVIRQEFPRVICDEYGNQIDDLFRYLQSRDVRVVVNQIGYSRWLLEEFLERGGSRWREGGGRIVTCLHFDPRMFSVTLSELFHHWSRRTPLQKIRRIGRITLLPLERRKFQTTLRDAYEYLIEASHNYILLSESHRRSLQAMCKTPHVDRIRVIPNLSTFQTCFPKEKLREKRKTALVVSRLDEPQKRVSLALRAWARVIDTGRFNEWKLEIVGDGEYASHYRELVEKENIKNVVFIGRVSPMAHYDRASIYLHTARREGWGLTITEAMQRGVVPIVMNSSEVFSELISDGDTGILSRNGSVRAFASNMIHLMSDLGRREEMAARAIEASRSYNKDSIVQSWISTLT